MSMPMSTNELPSGFSAGGSGTDADVIVASTHPQRDNDDAASRPYPPPII